MDYYWWRKRRNQAGVLLSFVCSIEDVEPKPVGRAWRVYEGWRRGRIGFREALTKLKKLASTSASAR